MVEYILVLLHQSHCDASLANNALYTVMTVARRRCRLTSVMPWLTLLNVRTDEVLHHEIQSQKVFTVCAGIEDGLNGSWVTSIISASRLVLQRIDLVLRQVLKFLPGCLRHDAPIRQHLDPIHIGLDDVFAGQDGAQMRL